MLPGTFPFTASLMPEVLQFGRYTYNTGFVGSGSLTIDVKALIPYVATGDNLELDAIGWQGSWSNGWMPRVRFFFKFGTAYYTGTIMGDYSGKSHNIEFYYGGGDTATVSHTYSGNSTNFPNVEVSIDRLQWRATNTEAANYYIKNLPI